MKFGTKNANVTMDLSEMNVQKGILSVPELCDKKLEVVLRRHGGVIRKEYDNAGRGVAFEREGKLYFLKGKVRRPDDTVAPAQAA